MLRLGREIILLRHFGGQLHIGTMYLAEIKQRPGSIETCAQVRPRKYIVLGRCEGTENIRNNRSDFCWVDGSDWHTLLIPDENNMNQEPASPTPDHAGIHYLFYLTYKLLNTSDSKPPTAYRTTLSRQGIHDFYHQLLETTKPR